MQCRTALNAGAGPRGRLGTLALTIVAVLAVVATPAAGAPADHSSAPVLTIPTPQSPPAQVGSSSLVRTDRGVSVTLETSGLEPGDVVTLWWIVANAPESCRAGLGPFSKCGPDDHVAGRGDMSVHHATGRVVDEDGTADYGAHLRVGDTSRGLFEGEPGLSNPRGAEVIVVLKTHGPRTPGLVSDQLRTFAGGCADQSTPPQLNARQDMLGRPGDNHCAEIQFSVHDPAR